MARPAVIDSTAPSVIAVKPESLRERVIVVILAVTLDSVWMSGRYDGFDAADVIWVTLIPAAPICPGKPRYFRLRRLGRARCRARLNFGKLPFAEGRIAVVG